MSLKTLEEVKALTKAQLVEYAADFGIALDKILSSAALVQQFLDKGGQVADASVPKSGTTVPNAGTADVPIGEHPTLKDDKIARTPNCSKFRRFLVTIHADSGPAGDADVTVAVNGTANTYKRNVKQSMTEPFVVALQRAEQTIFHKEGEGIEAHRVGRVVPTYACTVHGLDK